jgi:hypothetical protein
MLRELVTDLVGVETHRNFWGQDVGTATFKKPSGPDGTFTVSTTGDQAANLLMASARTRRFSITIEPSLVAAEAWAYRLVTAVAIPAPS